MREFRPLTVRELIEKLKDQDPDAVVIMYCGTSEDADYFTGGVLATTQLTARHEGDPDGVRPYVKGDWPDWYSTKSPPVNPRKVVIIS